MSLSTSTIKDIHIERFDSQLLSYNTDSIAPKKLKDLFVDPDLVYREKGNDENDYEQIKFTINDLLTSNKNFLITGIKESGKTCLINKIVDEAIEDIVFYNHVPIKIEFETLNSRRIESEINDFTKVGMKDVDELKEEHDILLLIDNIKFDEGHKIALKKLKTFLDKNPSARIISTSTVANQEEIPLDALKHNEGFEFKFLSLKGFKVQQIRSLVKKWFQDSEKIDTPEKVDSIVKLFKSLSLPRKPLAISILLWIIEKQEDYKPTNESTMLENFIERIFKKHSENEVYSAKFDHSNKTRILSALAVEMLEVGNENYNLKYSSALLFFEEYLEERLFTFEAQKILDYFIEIGVLIKDNGYVRFRFQCFFEYFLMKQMDYDDDFKSKILEEDNYLQFKNEIKYFSGIKRDQVEILELLMDRLESEFEPISKELYSNVDSIDDYFQMSESLVDQIDESTFLNEMEANKPTEEDLDQMNDRQLDLTNPDTGIKRKELPTNLISRLGNILNLAAIVLKNSEEITKSGTKQKAYQKILKAEVLYTVLYQFELKRFLEENSENLPFDLQSALGFLVNYTPTILQLSLYSNIGTEKLAYVFEKQIDKSFEDKKASDLEKFMSVFIYSENRGNNYPKKIKRLISNIRAKYIKDNTLLKLVTYFYLRTDDKSFEQKFLNLLAELIIESKGLPKSRKGKIISDYKKKKLISENTESQDQMILEM